MCAVCMLCAGGGLTGLLDPVAPGFACGSDTAHMSILGYDPVVCVVLYAARKVSVRDNCLAG